MTIAGEFHIDNGGKAAIKNSPKTNVSNSLATFDASLQERHRMLILFVERLEPVLTNNSDI